MTRLRWIIFSNVFAFMLGLVMFWILPVKADNPQTVVTIAPVNPVALPSSHRPPRLSMPLNATTAAVVLLASPAQSFATIIEDKCINLSPPKRFHSFTATIKNRNSAALQSYAAQLDCYELEMWLEP